MAIFYLIIAAAVAVMVWFAIVIPNKARNTLASGGYGDFSKDVEFVFAVSFAVVCFDRTRSKVAFLNCRVPIFRGIGPGGKLPPYACVGFEDRSFTCNFSDIESIQVTKSENNNIDVGVSFFEEIPTENRLKSISFVGHQNIEESFLSELHRLSIPVKC
jgi:hypothetical protein